MAVYVALLRAINVAGTGMLPMSELRELCVEAGFGDVKTYIQSGNVLFSSKHDRSRVQRLLEAALAKKMGKPVGVHLRTAAELASVLERNPFPGVAGNRVLVFFLESAPPPDALADLEVPGSEEVRLSGSEVFVHYPDGMGRSKLKIPFARTATARNLNTVEKLLELSRALERGAGAE